MALQLDIERFAYASKNQAYVSKNVREESLGSMVGGPHDEDEEAKSAFSIYQRFSLAPKAKPLSTNYWDRNQSHLAQKMARDLRFPASGKATG